MKRGMRAAAAAALGALMVLSTAAVAFAAPVLTLSANRTMVTYPAPTHLKVAATDGAASVPTTVTVSVKARLSRATAPSKVKAGKRVKVKGFIWPRHAKGSRAVVVKLWRWESGHWIYKGHVHPKIVRHSGNGSKWQFTRRVNRADKGKWRMRVYHKDAQHAASMSRYSYMRVR